MKDIEKIGDNRSMNQYNEDIDRIAEGLREYLQDFNEFTTKQKIKALEIVLRDHKGIIREVSIHYD